MGRGCTNDERKKNKKHVKKEEGIIKSVNNSIGKFCLKKLRRK
jgi:hypothetical protein